VPQSGPAYRRKLAAEELPKRASGKWAKEVAQFRHPKIESIRLGGDPNAPLLPENMTLDELRDSILVDLERLRERGVLDLPRNSEPPRHSPLPA
jgi:hypothetical protein